jgi:hypothetical protein
MVLNLQRWEKNRMNVVKSGGIMWIDGMAWVKKKKKKNRLELKFYGWFGKNCP